MLYATALAIVCSGAHACHMHAVTSDAVWTNGWRTTSDSMATENAETSKALASRAAAGWYMMRAEPFELRGSRGVEYRSMLCYRP